MSAYATEGENQTRGNPSLVDHRMVRFLDADQARRDLRRGGYRVDALRLCCTTFASRLLFFLPVLLASITFSEVTLRTTFPEPPRLLEASRIKLATSELMLTDFVCAKIAIWRCSSGFTRTMKLPE